MRTSSDETAVVEDEEEEDEKKVRARVARALASAPASIVSGWCDTLFYREQDAAI